MSAEAWIALGFGALAVIAAILTAVVGAAWWMSSLYNEVKSIGEKLTEIHQALVNDIKDVRRQIGKLKIRVGVLEGNADTEIYDEDDSDTSAGEG